MVVAPSLLVAISAVLGVLAIFALFMLRRSNFHPTQTTFNKTADGNHLLLSHVPDAHAQDRVLEIADDGASSVPSVAQKFEEDSQSEDAPADVTLEFAAAPITVPLGDIAEANKESRETSLDTLNLAPSALPWSNAEAPVTFDLTDPNCRFAEEPAALSIESSPEAAEARELNIKEPELPDIHAPLEDRETTPRPTRAAIYQDRRGHKRTPSATIPSASENLTSTDRAFRSTADVKLRLCLRSAPKTVQLTLVLARPEGFPTQVTLLVDGQSIVRSYDDQRYDDFDLTWSENLLSEEFRISSVEGFQWVRSARRLQLFSDDPTGPDLISVSAVQCGKRYAIVCKSADVPVVQSIAQSAGSPELVVHDGWKGIAARWSVLSGYIPARSATGVLEADFRPLDPGTDTGILLVGGLAIRPTIFAEGHPPCIEINGLAEGATIQIDGRVASKEAEGGWKASQWDIPGEHLIDIVPGPSLKYEILPDPARLDGWPFWNAHAGRFGAATNPWSRAEICGARIVGPKGETVLAAETQPFMSALGASREFVILQHRSEVGVSVGLIGQPPSFLIYSSGQRRKQGRVVVLGLEGAKPQLTVASPDFVWASAVSSAAAKHLPLETTDAIGSDLWHRAVSSARKLKKRRRRLT